MNQPKARTDNFPSAIQQRNNNTMGARHLTLVKHRDKYPVAQYGQWDGYPSGQGSTVLKFLQSWDRPLFEAKLDAVTQLTAEEGAAIDAKLKDGKLTLKEGWPELSRDTGAEILKMIQDRPPGLKLKSSFNFAGDSLFCEWAYLLDIDANKLEVYRGFNKEPLTPADRFFGVKETDEPSEYHPVKLVATYELTALPTVAKMEADCEKKEVEA
jgi:hypothetical protein